jgi:hypothetical protein
LEPRSYGSTDGDQISYDVNGVHRQVDLTELKTGIHFNDDQTAEKTLTITYANDEVLVTQILQVANTSYPTHTSWNITPVNAQIQNVTLYLSTFFDLYFNFDQAYLPGILNWENPWAKPLHPRTELIGQSLTSPKQHTDNYLALQDTTNKVTTP